MDSELGEENAQRRLTKRRRGIVSKKIVTIVTGLIIVLAGLVFIYYRNKEQNPIPLGIRQNTPFPIYYPDPKKMPPDYKLDINSLSSRQGVVVYAINYKSTKKLVISEEPKLAAADLQYFYAHHLPLHTTLSTSIGTATIGAIGSQSVTSLPTNDNTWLLITAPSNINESQLKELILSLKKP